MWMACTSTDWDLPTISMSSFIQTAVAYQVRQWRAASAVPTCNRAAPLPFPLALRLVSLLEPIGCPCRREWILARAVNGVGPIGQCSPITAQLGKIPAAFLAYAPLGGEGVRTAPLIPPAPIKFSGSTGRRQFVRQIGSLNPA